MSRPVILGNGALTVGLNEQGSVNDFYYPYVGLDNLTTARSVNHKIGVWINGVFSWTDGPGWVIDVNFDDDALVSDITMRSSDLATTLHFSDFVDTEHNAFCRRVTVKNDSSDDREIRLFMHQVFEISRAGRADTALFVPGDNYILDYKGRCCLLIYGQTDKGHLYDQFAIGNYSMEGKQGTYVDAEDGELSGSAVEHGGVDSVMRFALQIEGNSSRGVDYWIIAADSQYNAEKIHHVIKESGLATRQSKTEQWWQEWLAIGSNKLHAIDKKYLGITKKSLMIIKAHTDRRGGVIASCDSSIYNYGRDYYSYVWPRDGAFAIWPLIRLGYTDEPKKFFEFCRDILTPEGYLMHKYQPDRAIGSTWHPLLHDKRSELAIQEDETAIVIFMLSEYFAYTRDDDFVRNLYGTLIQPAANFLCDFVDKETSLPHASYDLWEEKFLTSTYTTAVTCQALLVAAEFARRYERPDDALKWNEAAEQIEEASTVLFNEDRGSYRKGFLHQPDGSLGFDDTIDISSLYGVFMFGLNRDAHHQIKSSLTAIEKTLFEKSPVGGVPRYEHDNYFASDPPYMGNPWVVTTLWLGQLYFRVGAKDRARHCLDWSIDRILPSGALPEQVNPTDGAPLSVTPLVWSHAELINTVLDLSHN